MGHRNVWPVFANLFITNAALVRVSGGPTHLVAVVRAVQVLALIGKTQCILESLSFFGYCPCMSSMKKSQLQMVLPGLFSAHSNALVAEMAFA